jgi:hypothetical protein
MVVYLLVAVLHQVALHQAVLHQVAFRQVVHYLYNKVISFIKNIK